MFPATSPAPLPAPSPTHYRAALNIVKKIKIAKYLPKTSAIR